MKLTRRGLFAALAGLFATAKAAPCLSKLRPAPERHCFLYAGTSQHGLPGQVIFFDEVVSICQPSNWLQRPWPTPCWEVRTQQRAPSHDPYRFAGIYEHHYLTGTHYTLFARAYADRSSPQSLRCSASKPLYTTPVDTSLPTTSATPPSNHISQRKRERIRTAQDAHLGNTGSTYSST